MTSTTRVVLYTGKGGVGKTTMAAAAGFAAAARGERVLLLSTDPAHSLADVLGCMLTGDPTAVPGGPAGNLYAAEVSIRGEFEAAWTTLRSYLVGMLAAGGVAEVTAEEITVFPGAEEIICLLQVEHWAGTGRFDTIVVDCAPTGETLRLLALPETVAFYADKLFSVPSRILRSVAAGLSGRFGSAAGPGQPVQDALSSLLDRITAARTLLTDHAVTQVQLVLTPDRMVVAEARRALTALSLHGYPVGGVVVNRILDDDAEGAWAATVRAGQQVQLAEIEESFVGLRIRRVTWLADEPAGPQALAALAARSHPASDGPDPAVVVRQLAVQGAAGDYRLTVPLPLAERGELGLSRSGDDLIVTVGAHRRRIALPAVLQRCRTTGAALADGELVISFEPDPNRWPSALAAAL